MDPQAKSQQSIKSPQNSSQPTTQQSQLQKKFYQKLNHAYDEYFLSDLQKVAMTKFIKTHFNKENKQVQRIKPWLLSKINNQKILPKDQMQKGCPDIIPGLRAKPWWDVNQFPWLKHFEQNYQVIRDQLLSLRNQKGFQPYRGPSWISQIKAKDGVGNQSVDSGTWNVFYLLLHNMKFDTNCQKVPKTMQLINKYIPNSYHHAFFSALTTKSHIMKHYGPTNKKLRFHLPLMGVKGSRMRVGNQTREQQEGKSYVFDDSFQHEAWHDGQQTRLILIVDFWHPGLSAVQLKFLKVLQNARSRAEAYLSQNDPEKDNFYTIIQNAKDLIKDNQWWVVKQ